MFDETVPKKVRTIAYETLVIEQTLGGIQLGRQEILNLCLLAGFIGLASVAVLLGFEQPAFLITMGLVQAAFAAWAWMEYEKRQTDVKASIATRTKELQAEGWDYYSGCLRKLEP
ncbi:hypothetical protein [Phaeobacter inhibens]|uniref:hypothetical protein n=1 Tax=Phaeobacter inhibens TaxID=221822 RepID=UPI0021A3CC44|nr:hypothetical protein [Phaeobacter inhibens]UWR56866.1 hypothetical protein K4F89_17895 [Phaeobacter inhibens]